MERRPSVLVFGAEWSGNSEIMHSMMERVSQEFNTDSQLQFFKVDIEKQVDIARFLGVDTVPTTIFLKDGEVLDFIKGFLPANKMRKKLRATYIELE